MTHNADTWNPAQYERFRDERARPFFDLLALVQPRDHLRAIDLGCGTGELTRELHRALKCRETLGIDTSPAMLAKARAMEEPNLRFEIGDLAAPRSDTFELVFSNAAVQWVDEHPALFAQLAQLVAPGGQLAVQMPANHDHPSHVIAADVAREEPFRSALAGHVRTSPVLAPERYAETLYPLGFREQHVRLQVYGHVLESSAGVIEWVKGTLLTDYEKRMPKELWPAFLARYRERLLPVLGEAKPYFYPFKRILLWGRREAA